MPKINLAPVMGSDKTFSSGMRKPATEIPVRLVSTLFRLTPRLSEPARPEREEVIIAADNEGDARAIAFLHDPRGREWADSTFADCTRIDAIGKHAHGDAVFITTGRAEIIIPSGHVPAPG